MTHQFAACHCLMLYCIVIYVCGAFARSIERSRLSNMCFKQLVETWQGQGDSWHGSITKQLAASCGINRWTTRQVVPLSLGVLEWTVQVCIKKLCQVMGDPGREQRSICRYSCTQGTVFDDLLHSCLRCSCSILARKLCCYKRRTSMLPLGTIITPKGDRFAVDGQTAVRCVARGV